MNRTNAHALVMLLCTISLAGCDTTTEVKSDVVRAPPGHDWKNAYVVVSYHPSFYDNGRQYPPKVLHNLFIEFAPPNRAQVVLVQKTTRDVSETEFDRLRATRYVLRFAPDGHALALSTDGGRSFIDVDLGLLTDSTRDPFWCPHHTYTSLTPWPSTRDLAIEIFSATDRALPASHLHGADRRLTWGEWFVDLEGATRYACAHTEDRALREAMIESFFRPRSFADIYEQPCIGGLARTDADLRARLDAAVAGAQGEDERGRFAMQARFAAQP